MNNRKKSDFKSIKESIILIIIFLLIALFFLKGCVDNNKVKNDGIKIINIKQKVSNFDDDTIYLNKSLKKDKKYSYDVTIHNYYNEDYYLYKIEINNESIDYDDLVKLL